MKEQLLVIVGPTAVGKTELSIELAKHFNGEVISGDSMQVYRGMDIGTAKVKKEEMQGIPHHMIDIKDPDETFSVAEFQEKARCLISSINNKGKIALLVGGTGLYVQAVTHDYQFSKISSDQDFRLEMEQYTDEYGNCRLHEKLKKIDPKSYAKIHPNNRRRVIRALEVYHKTGKTIHDIQSEQSESPYSLILIGLTLDREELYNRINRRVDLMIEKGLISEARNLYNRGIHNTQSMQAIGYKEIVQYLQGELSKEEATRVLKRNSRRYAKRQLTWFQNKMKIRWYNMSDNHRKKKQEIMEYVAGKLN